MQKAVRPAIRQPFFTRDRDFYSRFFRLLFFLALQNAIVTAVGLADNVMLGRYDENALAGVAQVNQLQFLLQMIVGGVGEGMLVLNAQYWGTRNLGAIRRVIAIGLRMAVGTGLVMMAAALLFPRQLLVLLTQDEAVIAEGMKYLSVMAWSYVIFCISNALLTGLRSVEDVKLGLIISLITLVINITLNYALIFGNLGMPRLGTYGAAIATLAARTAELAVVVCYLLKKEKVLKLRLRDLLGFDRTLFRDFMHAALPVMTTSGSWGIAMTVQAAVLGYLGVAATAASSVATSVFQILTVVCYGSATAAGILIGKAVGSGRVETVKSYTRTLQCIFLCIGVVTAALLYAVRQPVLSLYGSLTPETRELALQFMTVLSVTVVGTSYQMAVLSGIVRAGGSPRVQMINDIIFMWVIVLPLSLLAAFLWHWSPLVVFIILKCDQLLKCGTAVIVVNRYRWIRLLTRPEQKEAHGEG